MMRRHEVNSWWETNGGRESRMCIRSHFSINVTFSQGWYLVTQLVEEFWKYELYSTQVSKNYDEIAKINILAALSDDINSPLTP